MQSGRISRLLGFDLLKAFQHAGSALVRKPFRKKNLSNMKSAGFQPMNNSRKGVYDVYLQLNTRI